MFNFTLTTNDFEAANCSTAEPLSFIVPGWKEDINNNEWINVMVESMIIRRGLLTPILTFPLTYRSSDSSWRMCRRHGLLLLLKERRLLCSSETV